MIRASRSILAAAVCAAAAGCFAPVRPPVTPATAAPSVGQQTEAPAPPSPAVTLRADLDRIFSAPALARAVMAVRVESLLDGRVLYARNDATLVMPASNLKILTAAVAAERLGWDYRYETRLEATGSVADGVLHGDLVVTGSGDPSIGAPDAQPAELFFEWADALRKAGITRVDGRIVGDDGAFDEEGLGGGWAWDYLAAGYAAPAGGLSYNENVALLRITPGAAEGAPATIMIGPPGHVLDVVNDVTTGAEGSAATIDLLRLPGSARLQVRGRVPARGDAVVRTAAMDNPTRFFVEAMRLALADRGIIVSGGAWDQDDLAARPASEGRRLIATHQSEPLSSLIQYAMKVSQNVYGETLLKTVGRGSGQPGSIETGRNAARETLTAWGVPADTIVMADGSGLSRYDYVTAGAIVSVLRHVWQDERLRGPFVAALPVGGHDGTLDTRMRNGALDRLVQAKTGSMANVRSLSGYVETAAGEKLAFSMIANNFTAPAAEIDAVVEQALIALVGAR